MIGNDHLLANIVSLIQHLGVPEQRIFLHSLLRILSKRHLRDATGGIPDEIQQGCSKALRGAAALIFNFVKNTTVLKDGLVDWLTGVSGDDIGQEVDIRRAVLSALADDHGMLLKWTIGLPAYRLLARMLSVLKKSLESFGDKLSIMHTPMLRQEGISMLKFPAEFTLLIFHSQHSDSPDGCRHCTSQ